MTPASTLAMPRGVSAAVTTFSASSSVAGDRRNVRFFRPVAACGKDDQPPSMAAVPASLRAIQAKRKMSAPRAAAASAAECAVTALVKAVGVVQGAAAGGAAEATRGAGDAVAWVFSKAQFHSPDLAAILLGMLASFLGSAVKIEAERARVAAQAKISEPSDVDGYPLPDDADEDLPQLFEPGMEKEMWATIGIMHGDKDVFEDLDEDIQEINSAHARRRKAAYERAIAAGEANSLILSNYAQLLYEFGNDVKRAEMFFKQAVAAEPADGEAMRRYAMFLWHVRGDMGGAEDMFTGAIDEEPESSHIKSCYAWFLWMTGGVETCLIDNGKNNGDDAE